MSSLIIIAALAMFACVAITPEIQKLAWKLGITDRPDSHRKLHNKPIPLCGGVSVLFSLIIAIYAGFFIEHDGRAALRSDKTELVGLLFASVVIMGVGLADDRFNLRGRHKLVGQLLAASILVSSGLTISRIEAFGYSVDLGLLAVPCTLFWLAGAMNALNLLDGIDGLASTVGIVLSSAIAVIALINENTTDAIVAAGLAGSLLGFLRFNFAPATMFLGDAGSLLIGLLVGALAIRANAPATGPVTFAAPLAVWAVWAVPVFDSVAAIVRRKLTGRSIYTTDRGHMHHHFLGRTGSVPKTVLWIGLACAVTCAGGVAAVFLENDFIAIATTAAAITAMIATGTFGHVEWLLVRVKVAGLIQSIRHGRGSDPSGATQQAIRLQGSRPWDQLWKSLTSTADDMGLHEVRLDVNIPALHEGYHASWSSARRRDRSDLWTAELPLYTGQRLLGRLIVSGDPNDSAACTTIVETLSLLKPFEAQLLELATQGQVLSVPSVKPDGVFTAPGLADKPHAVGSSRGQSPLARPGVR